MIDTVTQGRGDEVIILSPCPRVSQSLRLLISVSPLLRVPESQISPWLNDYVIIFKRRPGP